MINLLAPESKRHIRAARQNVILRRYVWFIGLVALLAFSAFAYGYYLTTQERMRYQAEIDARADETAKYKGVRDTAAQYTQDLATARIILTNEVVFSSLLVDITKILPSGVVLNDLNLTTEMFGKEVTISARAKDANMRPLELKSRMEESALFSNVKILNIEEAVVDDPTKLNPIERTYPVSLELSATIDAKAGKRTTEELQ